MVGDYNTRITTGDLKGLTLQVKGLHLIPRVVHITKLQRRRSIDLWWQVHLELQGRLPLAAVADVLHHYKKRLGIAKIYIGRGIDNGNRKARVLIIANGVIHRVE